MTVSKRKRALELVRGGMSRTKAAVAVGVSKSTITHWLQNEGVTLDMRATPASPGGLCPTCCGLPHRRPLAGLCRCGEAFAAEALERPPVRVGVWEP